MPNADTDGRIIKQMIDEFVLSHRERSISFTSMGNLNYLSTLQFIDGIVGNSSSGILEAPSLNTATVNIGDRQMGRIQANSVINSDYSLKNIHNSIHKTLSLNFKKKIKKTINPYFKRGTAKKILEIIEKKILYKKNKLKKFYDIK